MNHISHLTKQNPEAGQTLIETLAAIFILTTAMVSALALAIYVLSNSGINENQIIATNLAREGVEVVRMMRDSNWLAGDAKDPNGNQPWGLQPCADIGGKYCYPGAHKKVPSYNKYDINSGTQRAVFDISNSEWSLENSNNYNLFLSNGRYSHSGSGVSNFSRMIDISFNGGPGTPYPNNDNNSNQEMIIKSIVAWRGKKCTWSGQNPTAAPASCKVTVEEHLTNWKDYR